MGPRSQCPRWNARHGRILSSGGSHRRVEVHHVATGKIVIGGTYEPHKGQKGYPLWLELAMDVIDRAMA